MRTPTISLVLLASAASLAAQNAFPLPASSGNTTAIENSAPFTIPARMTQSLVTNRSTLMAQGLPSSLNNWDMFALDPTGRFIFVPCENFGAGGGLFRYDTQTGIHAVIMHGNGTGGANRNANPATFNPGNDETVANDPCTWTPWGTVIWGEEATGGRFFETTNPLSPSGPFITVWHASIPAVSQEGMRFDSAGNLYFIDEDNSGCIYKFVPTVAGNLSAGQTFVLSIDAYANDPDAVPNENFNSASNQLTTRLGPATWLPLTDINGGQITPTNPFVYVTANSGRVAADEVFGTPFGRPEDLDVSVLANGNDVVYAALTSENRVISIELTGGTGAIVRDLCNYDSINLFTGSDVNPAQSTPFQSAGSGTVLNAPDNLAVDAWGNVYVIEDSNPGDVWKVVDANKDGVGEGIGLFVTLGVGGSEPTGMIFDPVKRDSFILGVQHPSSGNDAIWRFDAIPYNGSSADLDMLIGVNEFPRTGPGELVKVADGFDSIVIKVDSPSSTYYTEPFAVLLQPFLSGTNVPTFLPPLWIHPFLPSFLLVGGQVGQFPITLPFGGSSVAITVPPGLLGISALVQGVAVTNQGLLVLTDAAEFILK